MKELRSQTYGCSFINKQLSNYSFGYDCNPELLHWPLHFPFHVYCRDHLHMQHGVRMNMIKCNQKYPANNYVGKLRFIRLGL